MASEEYSVGYQEGYQEGWNAATEQAPPPRQPLADERKRAMQVYAPPFKHLRGYIHDAKSSMVSDNGGVVHRVRGWGRLSQLPNAEAIQDEIGSMMADALNEYYAAHNITPTTPPAPTPSD